MKPNLIVPCFGDAASEFIEEMQQAGLSPPPSLVPGRLHRFPGVGKNKGNLAGWCRLFEDGLGGIYGDWASALYGVWKYQSSKAYRENIPVSSTEIRRQADLPKSDQRTSLRTYAREIWRNAVRNDALVTSHPYAVRKKIGQAFGAGRSRVSTRLLHHNADVVVVPIRENGTAEVLAVQAINPEGAKQTFGAMECGFLLLGNERDQNAGWFIVEGWATGYAFRLNWPRSIVCVAFGKGRLDKVAGSVASIYQPKRVVILEEDDD